MRVHLVGLPHNDPVRAVEWCAYASKTRRLADMLTATGHEVVLYGGPGCDATVAEHVEVVSDADRRRWFGAETWEQRVFDRWDPADVCWSEMGTRAVAAIRERVGPHDLIGITMGRCQQVVADAFPHHVRAEVGIGYEGPLPSTHWCCESWAWLHWLYGREGITDGRFFDTAIPNPYDPSDLSWRPDHDGYLLFLARMIPRKGLDVVAELAKRFRVVTAGQGDERVPGAEHVGVVTGRDKADLIAGAAALVLPTRYVGPYEGAAVEGMMSGVPAITTGWGAFTETVEQDVTGWRCATLGDFVAAARMALDCHLDRATVRDRACGRFSTAAVAPQYDAWLRRLSSLYRDGWYDETPTIGSLVTT